MSTSQFPPIVNTTTQSQQSTQPVTTKPSAGAVVDTVLHDVVYMGVLAASIFVKNPAHQQTAANLTNAIMKLLPMLDAQLNPQASQLQ